jgi:hypothetical protein
MKPCKLLYFFLLLNGPVLRAQTVTGTINGTVTDATGSVIPGAVVDILNQTTSLKRSATSSEIGTFTVTLLPPGSYTVSISKPGFGTQTRKDVELLVNQNLTLDTTLTPSNVEQTIEVTGTAPVLETTTGTIGKVIQGETIVDLPLNGRKFTQFVLLTPSGRGSNHIIGKPTEQCPQS